MKKFFYLIVILAFILSACSLTDKFLGQDKCEEDIVSQTFENYKYKAQYIGNLIEGVGVLKSVDKSLTNNFSKVTSWIKDIPSLDRVHKKATECLISSNINFLKAANESESLNKLEKELSLLSKNASEDEKQAKYLELLNDPALQNKMQELSASSQQISSEKKGFLDKAYAHLTYSLIYDAASIGLSSLVITQGKSQLESIKLSKDNPVEIAQKSRCLQRSVTMATDIATEATQQVTPAVGIYNSIVKLYSNNGYSLPEVTSATGEPINTDL